MRDIVETTIRIRQAKGYFYNAGAVDRIVAWTDRRLKRIPLRFRGDVDRVLDIIEEYITKEEMHPESIRAKRFFNSIALPGWCEWAQIASATV